MPRNKTSPEQVARNWDQLRRTLLRPLYALDQAVGLDPANNPQYGGYKPESQMSPLERRKYYMSCSRINHWNPLTACQRRVACVDTPTGAGIPIRGF
jgi:hypothetical protein